MQAQLDPTMRMRCICDASIDAVWVQCMCSVCIHAQLDPALLGAIIKVATKPLLAGPQPAAEVAQSLVFQLLAVPALAACREGATCRAVPQRAPPEKPGWARPIVGCMAGRPRSRNALQGRRCQGH